jgi:hypothetical protein
MTETNLKTRKSRELIKVILCIIGMLMALPWQAERWLPAYP